MNDTLKALRANEVSGADDLIHPGDFYLRKVPLYNSNAHIEAIVLKCPFCSRDMMSTAGHKISHDFFRKLLARFGFNSGVTVRPKLVCPYNQHHRFLITNGRISSVAI